MKSFASAMWSGYGANPNECADIVRRLCSVVVLGNHDAAALDPAGPHDFNPIAQKAIEWTADQLTDENRSFLLSLPMEEKKENIILVHSSPAQPELWDYVINADDAVSTIHQFEEKICFIGHTHVPGIFHPMAGQNQFLRPNNISSMSAVSASRGMEIRCSRSAFLIRLHGSMS